MYPKRGCSVKRLDLSSSEERPERSLPSYRGTRLLKRRHGAKEVADSGNGLLPPALCAVGVEVWVFSLLDDQVPRRSPLVQLVDRSSVVHQMHGGPSPRRLVKEWEDPYLHSHCAKPQRKEIMGHHIFFFFSCSVSRYHWLHENLVVQVYESSHSFTISQLPGASVSNAPDRHIVGVRVCPRGGKRITSKQMEHTSYGSRSSVFVCVGEEAEHPHDEKK